MIAVTGAAPARTNITHMRVWTAAALAAALLEAAPLWAKLPLQVRETAGIARSQEIAQTGIPIPRGMNLTNVAELAVTDAAGTPIPAEFRVLARWNAARTDTTAPIQWVLVAFPASVGANATTTYRLVTNGSIANPAPTTSLQVTRNANRVVVQTGTATFTIDAASSTLFEEIRLGATPLVSGGSLAFASLRTLTIEHAGPLTAAVTVTGTVDANGLSTQRRYLFTAGSSTAIVRQTLAWEGRVCDGAGEIVCGNAPNARRIDRVRDTLAVSLAAPLDVTVIGARNAAALRGVATAAHVQQNLRTSRTAPPSFNAALAAQSVNGAKADGALLAVSGASGTVAVALDHMHRYEPQGLRLENGALAIDIAADRTWLGARQGLFAMFAVGAAASGASRETLERTVWAPLNRPLRAWPEGSWFTMSGAVDPVPPRNLAAPFDDYDVAMRNVLERTVEATDDLGVYGLMTFGLFPRAWGDPLLSDEIDCFGNDPTPQESWDDLYWCSTWTDYHNAAYTAAAHAMRTGEVEWLDEIARPAALRQLFTQIYQCAPGDNYFYCGQAPAGYGGYRADFNSSHAYFDNLFLHYWLTGDAAVVDTLRRGATSMRDYLCSRRPAAACQPTDPPIDEWANLTGRVASQWALAFRFVGLASSDAGFLDDWRANMARAVTQQYVALDQNGTRYGFILGGWQPVTGASSHTTDQLWMTALYDMKSLEILRRDTADAPLGQPPQRPSEIVTAFARTLARFGPGTIDGEWPNQLDLTGTGPRIGGTLTSVRATPGGGDPLLYDTGKATLAGPLAAATALTNDAALRALATEAAMLAIRASINERAPLGKIQAEFLARLHAAVSILAPPEPASPPRRRASGR